MESLAFLSMVFLISFTGAMAPGPLTFGAFVQGVEDPWAGLKVSIGHSILEVPLIIAIYLGVAALMDEQAIAAIGLLGGSLLLILGGQMVRDRNRYAAKETSVGRKSTTVGFLASAGNPYTWIWWLTVGAALIAQAVGFGLWLLPLFIIVHLSTDFVWIGLVAYSTNKSRSLLSAAWMSRVVALAGMLLMAFGVYFLSDSLAFFRL